MNNGHSDAGSQLDFAEGETLLVLVRHAETTWNLERRIQGHLNVPLSAEGHRQAAKVADWLARLPRSFPVLYSSDLRRASETAEPIARRLELAPIYTEALREANCGEWQGLLLSEVEENYPGQLRWWHTHVASFIVPGGESISGVQHRVSEAISGMLRRHKGEAIIVISHGAALAAAIATLNGWDLQETWDAQRARLSNTGVTAMAFPADDGPPRITLANSIIHLGIPYGLAPASTTEPPDNIRKSTAEFAV